MSFLLSPTPCTTSVSLLLMVSSGPLNQVNRDRWRKDVEGREGVKLIFLVAKAVKESDQILLETEHESYGDIVHPSLVD